MATGTSFNGSLLVQTRLFRRIRSIAELPFGDSSRLPTLDELSSTIRGSGLEI
jgi:hypothetical protein